MTVFRIALVGQLLLLAPGAGSAQDYRGRVQGSVLDSTQGALPGTTVTMVNDATGVAVTFVADSDGHDAFNTIVWDNPDVNVSSANFGKVTRKRTDTGREVQIGLRFVF